MKTKLSLILGGLLLLSPAAMAASNVFPAAAPGTAFAVKAAVPSAASISITVNSVDAATGKIFTPVTTPTLDFGTLTFTTTGTPPINVYLPNHYFTLDVAATAGGAGTPDTNFTYAEGAVPTGQPTTSALGSKSSIVFAKEVFTSSSTPPDETLLTTFGPRRLNQMSATNIPFTSVTGGWLRAYVGVCTGNPATDPAGCVPFTNADVAGNYSGTLTVTATVH